MMPLIAVREEGEGHRPSLTGLNLMWVRRSTFRGRGPVISWMPRDGSVFLRLRVRCGIKPYVLWSVDRREIS